MLVRDRESSSLTLEFDADIASGLVELLESLSLRASACRAMAIALPAEAPSVLPPLEPARLRAPSGVSVPDAFSCNTRR